MNLEHVVSMGPGFFYSCLPIQSTCPLYHRTGGKTT